MFIKMRSRPLHSSGFWFLGLWVHVDLSDWPYPTSEVSTSPRRGNVSSVIFKTVGFPIDKTLSIYVDTYIGESPLWV